MADNETYTHAKKIAAELAQVREMVETGAGTGGINPGIINNKGDIIVGTGNDTPGVIPAGINGQLLSSDSSTSTGLKWVNAPTGGGSSAVTSVAGKTGDVTLAKADVGLSNADNTSDAAKPVSTATQNALNLKANTADVNNALSAKADLVGGKVPSSQLPSIASGTGVQVWEWYVDTAAVGLGTLRRYNDSGETLTVVAVRVRANINPPEGSDLVVDVVKNGSASLWTNATNRPKVVSGTQDSNKKTDMNTVAVADGEYLVPNIVSVGSLVPGSGVLVSVTLR